ncbi:MAG: 50S ribosomal protein L23 [Candidatus Sungbacteria bacterium]|nr:50S ribosomal protein L23 [Candidatus Sungbacteria bacterium]
MSLLNLLKRKKEPVVKEKEDKSFAKPVLVEPKDSVQDETVEKKSGKAVWGVIIRPHVTEKSSDAGGENKYMFIVSQGSNKRSIKQAVEGRYGVSVKKVGVLTMPEKKRMRGRQTGWRQGFKKAVVTLKEGQAIELQ